MVHGNINHSDYNFIFKSDYNLSVFTKVLYQCHLFNLTIFFLYNVVMLNDVEIV
jgi:hypothetical protein